MPPHEAVIGAQGGGLLPIVAGHLVEQRALAVHHLVMAEGQDEVLTERVQQAERHVVMMVSAMHRLLAHVAQRVVHPAHVPFEAEPQRSEEHTSELQSLMRRSHSVFFLKKQKAKSRSYT